MLPEFSQREAPKSSRQQIASEYSAHFPMVASVEPAFNRASHVLNGTIIPAARTRSDGVRKPGGPGLPTVPWRGLCSRPSSDSRTSRCKPSTQKSVRLVLNGLLLPAFGPMPLDRIGRIAVTRWFDEYSRTAPGEANRALNLLRQILNHAIDYGHLDTNPTHGIKRNPRPRLTRFLSCDEVHRLHRVLDRYAGARPARAQQADIIRLLLLTGCRKNEIVTMRWQDVDGDTVNLADAKTGPRQVFLNAPARAILQRQPQSNSPWVFPSPLDPGRPQCSDLPLWYAVRRQAGIEDVRIHDLRHTYASHAVLQGVPQPVVSRLLGHKNPGITLRYVHVGDRETEAAAERIGEAIAQALEVSYGDDGVETMVFPDTACQGLGNL